MIFKGIVKDELGEPLWGAHVSTMFRTTNIGVTTEENGVFTIEDARTDESWKLSYLGYEEIIFNIPRNGGTQVFEMKPTAIALEGFTGTPDTNKKKSNAGIAIFLGLIGLAFLFSTGNTTE